MLLALSATTGALEAPTLLRGSVAPRARQTALWELRLFFPQSSDTDMQGQLGLRRERDADRTVSAVGAAAVGGVIASLGLADPAADALPPTLHAALGGAAMAMPFATLGLSVSAPDLLNRLLVTLWRSDPRYRRRLAYHEAGHFLVGYLVGLEVDSYDAATGAGGRSSVQFSSRVDTVGASHEVLDRLAVVSMAGIAGEVVACGDAEGGTADVQMLRAAMRVASPAVASQSAQDDRIRWATMMALTLLQRHQASLDELAACLEEGAAVDTCERAIESAAFASTATAAARSERATVGCEDAREAASVQ